MVARISPRTSPSAEVAWRAGCRLATFDKTVLQAFLDMAIRPGLPADL